jgi:NAD(P)H-flavin reductase
MVPRPFRVASRAQETPDVWTLELAPLVGAAGGSDPAGLADSAGFADPAGLAGQPAPAVEPGQFMMLYAFGVGEVPVSLSGTSDGRLVHTVRAVGAVTRALCAAQPGDVIGVRGPFGRGWPVHEAAGADVVVVAGGLGLAPLRPLIRRLLARRERYGELAILSGSRSPADVCYPDELERWRGRGAQVGVTVDTAGREWTGAVGVVTSLLAGARFDPADAVAFTCGPEIMMRRVAQALADAGVAEDRIYLSMERSMHCGIGHCGHCQLGPTLTCRDGPVYGYDEIGPLMAVREL